MFKPALLKNNCLFSSKFKSFSFTVVNLFSTVKTKTHVLQECCEVLEIKLNCSETELRAAYLNKVKEHHPDRKNSTDDSNVVINNIYSAYETLLMHRRNVTHEAEIDQSLRSQNEEEGEEADVKHTVPQHRRYLTFEGVGYGTPSQRRRQYQQFKVARANNRVFEHRKMKLGVTEDAIVAKDKEHAQKIKTSNFIHRLVDDMIRESMQRGDFDNLPGKGKPLDYTNHNPHLDSTTHNLNRILVNNGFMPEWIMLSKEIRSEMATARQNLAVIRMKLGTPPFSEQDSIRWAFHVEKFTSSVQGININVNKFNFIVPFMEKQMVHYNVQANIDKIVDNPHLYLPKDGNGNSIEIQDLTFPNQETVDDRIKWADVWTNIKDVFKYR